MSWLPAPSSRDGTVIATATTIAYPMSACHWPHILRNHTHCRSWRFTLVSTLQCGRGNDTPVASQVINHWSISRAPEGLQLPKTARSLRQTDLASPSCHERTIIAGKTVLLFLLPGLPRHPGLHLFRAAGSLFSRDDG